MKKDKLTYKSNANIRNFSIDDIGKLSINDIKKLMNNINIELMKANVYAQDVSSIVTRINDIIQKAIIQITIK